MQALSVSQATAETAGQVSNVLAILDGIMPLLCFQEEAHRDGEARIAASTTCIKACDRLETILSQSDRWAPPPPGDHTAAVMDAVAQSQIDANTMQAGLAIELARPSSRFRPQLERQRDGSWRAYFDKTKRNSVIGVGPTPDAAMMDFDNQILGEMPVENESGNDEKEMDE